MSGTARIFIAGYHYGRKHGACSVRDAAHALYARMLPDNWEDCAVFCNGSEDGAAGDDWRYSRAVAEELSAGAAEQTREEYRYRRGNR